MIKTVEKVFNVKNPFMRSMGTVFDLFVLNIMWVVCCIPIVTIGPATAAAFYVLIQRARNEHGYMWKDFLRSFKANLKQGMLLGILLTLVGAFLAGDIYLCRISGTGIYSFFLFFFAVFFVFWAMTTLYAFPILAKFERTTKEILIWAFTLSIKNILLTLTMLFTIIVGMYMCHALPGLLFIMFGLLFQYCSTIFASIFKPFLPVPDYLQDEMAGLYDFNPKPKENTSIDEAALADEAAMMGMSVEDYKKLVSGEGGYEG